MKTKRIIAGRYRIVADIPAPDGVAVGWFIVKGERLGAEVITDYGTERKAGASHFPRIVDWTDEVEVTLADGTVVDLCEGLSYERGDYATKGALVAFLSGKAPPTIVVGHGTAWIE